MNKNTYKSKKKQGLFSYLERAMHFEGTTFHGLPGRYVPKLLFVFCSTVG
jgi:hypothetical protein